MSGREGGCKAACCALAGGSAWEICPPTTSIRLKVALAEGAMREEEGVVGRRRRGIGMGTGG